MRSFAPRIGLLFTSPPLASIHFFIHRCKLLLSLDFSNSSSYLSKRDDEQSRNLKVSVWWDFENCSLPVGINAFRVSYCIADAVRVSGIKGPIQITAFGDIMALSRSNQEALSSTGIILTHTPRGAGKNSADRSLLVDLMYWVSKNPPPAHIFLISGDRDFANILHRLRMNNYNILLASYNSAPSVLCSAATIMWPWSALVRGQNPSGKFLNQPPDGLYNSWYGQYNLPINDTSRIEQSSFSSHFEMAEFKSDSGSDLELSSTVDNSASDSNEKSNRLNDFSMKNKVLCNESFWDDMGVFLDTPKGAVIVSQSRNREEMASAFQKHGPAVLKSLEKIGALHLVHLLLTDKKWLREHRSKTSPYQLTENYRNYLALPRGTIVADSQSRVNELLKDHPKGFFLSAFMKLFAKKFGYILDYKMFGHRKLITFMRLIPGVRVHSNYVFPREFGTGRFGRR